VTSDKEKLFNMFLENPTGNVKLIDNEGDPKKIVGVPLGGIGTGKIELTPDGVFRHFTINNNYVFPIDSMRGTFLSVGVGSSEGYRAKLLLSDPKFIEVDDQSLLLNPDEIEYRGLWPRCMVTYNPQDLPIRIILTAFSPVIPRQLETNCLPLVYFLFEVENTSSHSLEVSVNFSWEDVNGCWGSKVSWDDWVPPTEPHYSDDRGYVKVHRLTDALAVSFHHREDHPEVANFAWGDYTLAVKGDEIEGSVFQYDPKHPLKPVELLKKQGRIHDSVTNGPGEYAAVLSARCRLGSGEKKRVSYALSWYTPDCWGFGDGSIQGRLAGPEDFAGSKIGHWYTNFYASSLDIIKTHLNSGEEYLRRVEAWQKAVLSSTLPVWLKEMLINNNYILSTNMYWAKDGRFSILESPNCPCIGTLDQRFYGSPATMLFVPSLENNELVQYAEYSDKMYQHTGENKGQIYHDFGNNRLDSYNTYGYNWIDLNPKFVLLCWRNYLYSGNLDHLEDLYYKMKEAMEREEELDRDKDGLPEGYRNCNTYENRFYCANSYDGGLWLAALRVFPDVARLMGDEDAALRYERLFGKARDSFEAKLWDDKRRHYIKCTEKGSPDPNTQCRDDQLTGQWYAHFLNKGYVHPVNRVKDALSTIIDILKKEIPGNNGSYIICQEEFQNERPVKGNWPGYSVAHFAVQAIYEGLINEGLGAVKGIWEIIYDRYKMLWDQPLGLEVEGRPRGDRYMNSGSIWYVLWALQGFWINVRDGIMKVSPNIPDEWKSKFVTPIVTSAFWGMLEWREITQDNTFSAFLRFSTDEDFTLNRLILKGLPGKYLQSFEVKGYDVGAEWKTRDGDYSTVVVDFEGGLDLLKDKAVEISYTLR